MKRFEYEITQHLADTFTGTPLCRSREQLQAVPVEKEEMYEPSHI